MDGYCAQLNYSRVDIPHLQGSSLSKPFDFLHIAMLFQDEDSEIESLVKQFFSEVNRKDPRYLFSIIPEALTRFSEQAKMMVSEGNITNDKTFTVFLENVLPLMEKDKYS